MGGHDFRSWNAAKKGFKEEVCDAEMDGLSASNAWGNTRRAKKTADDAAWKQNLRFDVQPV